MKKTGAVIVAAGHKNRGTAFLPMLPVGDSTVIRRIIITMRRVGIDPIVVVTGKQGDELEKHISDLEVISLRNPDYETEQMFDSISMGLRYIRGLCTQSSDVAKTHRNAVKHLFRFVIGIAQGNNLQIAYMLLQLISLFSRHYHNRINPHPPHRNNDPTDHGAVPYREHGQKGRSSVFMACRHNDCSCFFHIRVLLLTVK